MANPTTNFGWVMPTTKSLVTNLPADFNTFGQGVDTSMAGLLGGTTGQILSKTSGTNMAFTWINNDQGDITGVTAGTGISVTSGTGPVPTVAIDSALTPQLNTANTFTGGKQQITAATAATIPLVAKGAASQSANLQEWQNSSGTVLAYVNPSGTVVSTGGIYLAVSGGYAIQANASTASTVPMIAQGAASQSANFQQWQDSTGTVLAKVTPSGNFVGTSSYTAKTAAYTFVSGDEGNLFSMNAATSVQFNIPTDATFDFRIGTELNVFWITGVGQPTIGAVTPGTTTVISTGATSATPKLRVANSGATIKKLAANSWIVFGDIA